MIERAVEFTDFNQFCTFLTNCSERTLTHPRIHTVDVDMELPSGGRVLVMISSGPATSLTPGRDPEALRIRAVFLGAVTPDPSAAASFLSYGTEITREGRRFVDMGRNGGVTGISESREWAEEIERAIQAGLLRTQRDRESVERGSHPGCSPSLL
jgi:hypothetical protein